MNEQVAHIGTQVDHQLDDFQESMDKLAHDAKEVDEMDERLQELMGHHLNLMGWKDKEKHRTVMWRDAVEEQLRKLGKDVSHEDADLKKAELEEEETSQMAAAAAMAAEEVSGAMLNQQASEKRKEDSERYAMEALKRGEQSGKGLLAALDGNTQQLQAKTGDLETTTKTAKGAINALALAQMTGSPENVATDRKYDNLEVTMKSLEAKMPGSLLQTSSQVLPQSLAEIKG